MDSKKIQEISGVTRLDNFIRVWHLAMIVFSLAALFTGELADDYKKVEQTGYIIHGALGMAVSFFVCLYFGYGLVGPAGLRFSRWFPFTGERLRRTRLDLSEIARKKLPKHETRQGLAGLVQFCGMLIFGWLAGSGLLMYFLLEPGSKARGLAHAVKEAHEVGAVLIPIYLCLHVGAVIAHSLIGEQVWRDIFFLKKNKDNN